MKRFLSILAVSVLICTTMVAQSDYGIIPKPVSLEQREGTFRINSKTTIIYPSDSGRVQEIATDFCNQINLVTGLNIACIASDTTILKDYEIVLLFAEGMAEEGYTLIVEPKRIEIIATTEQGLYYGIQSIYQLMPAQVYGDKKAKGIKWEIPCCRIEDEPRFSYRGMMLDCGRYFMPKETIFKFIDMLAMHKQNIFHWHLTDDQGWRIEIKKYPRLTEVGAWRDFTSGYEKDPSDNTPHGGFYTQDDAREVVEYARRRGVTVVPEIELPGHATAAIAAYPELSCFPKEICGGYFLECQKRCILPFGCHIPIFRRCLHGTVRYFSFDLLSHRRRRVSSR